MESCPIYTDDDKKWKNETKDGTMFLYSSKKESDFSKLTMKYSDSIDLPAIERAEILKDIHTWIECDMNLTLLEAQKNQNKKIYRECMGLINSAIRHGMDVSIWQEKVDKLFPIEFLRDVSLWYFQESIDTMKEYSEKSTWFDHMIVFSQGYRWTKEAIDNLVALGVPKEQLNKITDPIVEKFIWVYLSDALQLAQWFLEWKSGLRLSSSNPVTEWRKDINEALYVYRGITGNSNIEYQKIVWEYNKILPSMMKIETDIEIQRVKSEIHDRNLFK